MLTNDWGGRSEAVLTKRIFIHSSQHELDRTSIRSNTANVNHWIHGS